MNFVEFNLHPTLLANLGAQGFTQPTPIQAEAIPHALAGGNLVGLAQTGTGKTAAFVLPMLHRLMAGQPGGIRALIVTPTRELADQINTAVRTFGVGTGIRSVAIYGGVGFVPQEQALRSGVDIVVACPGRLLDLLQRGVLRLDKVQTLVLDEADRMLDMGFLPAIRRILAAVPARRQTMLFSATLPPELRDLVATTAPNATTVQIGIAQPAQTVAHALYPVAGHRKADLLVELIQRVDEGSVLVFTRTKHRANRLLQQVLRAGHQAAVLHSNKSQNQRQIALDGFRDGRFRVLVATDIAARGLDVERVSHVINFDIPDTPDAYIHRIGRTGRATRNGDAYTLIVPEDSMQVRAIERVLGSTIERRRIEGFDYDAPPPAVALDHRPPHPGRGQGQGGRPAQRSNSAPDRRADRPTRRSA